MAGTRTGGAWHKTSGQEREDRKRGTRPPPQKPVVFLSPSPAGRGFGRFGTRRSGRRRDSELRRRSGRETQGLGPRSQPHGRSRSSSSRGILPAVQGGIGDRQSLEPESRREGLSGPDKMLPTSRRSG